MAAEATRLRRFVPPFRFTSFFAPEDTLLCVLAAEGALAALRKRRPRPDDAPPADAPALLGGASREAGPASLRVVELTTGSGLVGLRLLDLEPRATLFAVDIDHEAPSVASANAERLGLADRARFQRASIWERALARGLRAEPVDLLVCNPPYIPEPPGAALQVEAGAGADGTAHVRRVLEIANDARPAALVLSWCSLADPSAIVADAERMGYRLDALYVVAIGDGEYSGGVHRYLRSLPTAFLSEAPDVVAEVAPDGAARFAYLLLAGVFSDERASKPRSASRRAAGASAEAVDRLVRDFVAHGAAALAAPEAPFAVKAWLLDRWDEITLRAFLHGAVDHGALDHGVPRASPPAAATPAAPATG